MSEIAGKNVLITGGGSGIGRRVALRTARLGGKVIVWDIDQANLEKVLREIEAATGRPGRGAVCDVSDRASVRSCAEEAKAEAGPVDILINNAGVVSGRPILELSEEKIESVFAVNSLALFWTTRAFLPHMVEANTGHIVTVASAAGVIGVARLAEYCASKWAAVGFDEALRMELRQIAPGVKTTVVCPYFIDTGMFEGVKTRVSLLLPILKEEVVAQRIVSAIRRNKRRLMMPRLVYLVPVLRILPTSVFDLVADIMGINAAMDEFRGRN